MYILGQVFKLIKLLNSEKGAVALSSGAAMGMLLGLLPFNFLLVATIFFFFCLLRINGGAMFLAWALFGFLAFFLDPLFDAFGYWLLMGIPALHPLWTSLYNLPMVPWTRFNNSIVLGSLVIGLILFVPAIFFFKFLIGRYRDSVVKKVTASEWFKVVKATKLYKLYEKYSGLKESLS